MPVDGRFRDYYWRLGAFLAAKSTILDETHEDYRYDNAPHHPHLATHPHHMHKGARPVRGKDKAFDTDLPEMSFIAVVSKIERAYLGEWSDKV